MRGVPRPAFALLAVPVAVLSETAGWRDVEPDVFAAIVYTAMVAGILAVGVVAGWRGAVVFAAVFAVAAAVEETWVYTEPNPAGCDPFCSSPWTGIFYGLPFAMLLITIGAVARGFVKSVQARRVNSK